MSIYKKIETGNGVYTVKTPLGRIGAIHFGIISKCVPGDMSDGDDTLSPAAQEKLYEGFLEWSQKVLPNIITEGPFKYDEMPGEDQYAIFIALFSTLNIKGDFFRIVE
jgi:hypothetical protein